MEVGSEANCDDCFRGMIAGTTQSIRASRSSSNFNSVQCSQDGEAMSIGGEHRLPKAGD